MSGGLRLPKFLEKMWWRGRKNLTQKLRCTCTRRWLTAGSWRRSSTLSMKTSSTYQASNSQKMWFVEQYVELLLHVWHEQCVRLISVYLIQAITFEMWVWCLYVWSALLILATREAYFFFLTFLPWLQVAVPDLLEATREADILVFVLPHQYVHKICSTLKNNIKQGTVAVSLIKVKKNILKIKSSKKSDTHLWICIYYSFST